MIFQLLVFVYFVTAAFSSPINPYLVCEGKRWESIFTFFASNYIAHALTTIPVPGANWVDQTLLTFSALMVPNVGLIGAIRGVTCYVLQGRSDDLHRALARNALLILVKEEDIRTGDEKVTLNSRQVHGEIKIPPGYTLIVPNQRQHRDEMARALRKSGEIKLCRSIEVVGAVVGIAQVIFSSITIYRARGDQIEKYGYAAYGLSVYPYALMSVANLLKLLVCGRYPYAYVLRTDTLVEEEKKGGVFEGAVGKLGVNHGDSNDSQDGDPMAVFSDPPPWLKYVSFPSLRPLGDYRGRRCVPIIGSSIVVIAVISQPIFVVLVGGSNPGKSTLNQRFFMFGWLVANVGSVVASSMDIMNMTIDKESRDPLYLVRNWRLLVIIISSGAALTFSYGGFATVGEMLHAEISYQLC